MQVSVESISNLERCLTVQVPAERVDKEVESRLQSMKGRVRVDGFRPGKVPMKVIKQRYGAGVFHEVVGEVVQSTFYEAVSKEELRMAGMPTIEPLKTEQGEPLEYKATFEVYPDISIADLSGIEVVETKVEIAEADVDKMIDNLRKQRQTWKAVEREARDGDQVILDFVGRVDGEEFEGGTGEGMPVELGSGRMIAGFEDQLKGIKTGEERVLNVTFPDEYPSETVKGKPAEFSVTATAVNEPALPEVDEEFAKQFGVEDGSVETLRNDVKENMARELSNTLEMKVKNQVMDALVDAHDVEVPSSLVKDEVGKLREQAMSSTGQPDGSQFPDEMFQENATRRVKLGLIIGEIIRQNDIQPDEERVNKTLDNLAVGYEDPQMVIDYYRKSPEQMQSVHGLVLEEQVVEWVKSQANVSDETKTFEEVMVPTAAS